MIEHVTPDNVETAARIHSESWRESHRSFCSPDFVAAHTPQRQSVYIRRKMEAGTRFFLLSDAEPVGIVSVTGNLIEDLYILPQFHRRGYGSRLLRFAIDQCTGDPTLWILENNSAAEALYRKFGFLPTGRRNSISEKLDETEFVLCMESRIPAIQAGKQE